MARHPYPDNLHPSPEAHRLMGAARRGADQAVLKPMRLFHFSITYVTLLFLGVAIDPLLHLPLPGLS